MSQCFDLYFDWVFLDRSQIVNSAAMTPGINLERLMSLNFDGIFFNHSFVFLFTNATRIQIYNFNRLFVNKDI